ncbi:MAG: cyclic nucleotide-binding domain-containing protein [Gammaproteobacteria bacterium]|nr:cyclic nucleotide-binding domain-containing protein [Gammaproteobacteria bacterium]
MFDILHTLFEDPSFTSQVKWTKKKYKAHDKILEQDTPHPNFYLILKGKVRVVRHADTTSKQHVQPGIADLSPPDIFGEFGLFDDSPASADVIAITRSELIEIEIVTFRAFLDANPKMGYEILSDILKTLVTRLRRADKTIAGLFAWGIEAHKIDKEL